MIATTLNPVHMLCALYKQRYLIGLMVRRDVVLKYKGSYLGIGWSFLYPLFLLFSFTLVFGGVFGGRWNTADGGMKGLELALFIYCALVVFSPFSEAMTSAPRVLISNQNFVKKIIFPTEILPLVSVLSATVHGGAHLVLLMIASVIAGHGHLTAMLAPVVLLPTWLLSLGLAWFLTASGTYVRDLAHGMPVLTQLLMFTLPVFYPLDAAPPFLRTLHRFDPLAFAMEDMRRTVLVGAQPEWGRWFVMLAIGLVVAFLGYAFFNRCREEFADVL